MNDLMERIKEINLKDFIERHYGVEFSFDDKSVCILPGHVEKTPSMKYYKEQNTVTCFGCDELRGANIFVVVSKMLGLELKPNFKHILQVICNLEDIEFEETKKSPEQFRRDEELKRKTNVASTYKQNLNSNKNSEAYTYLTDRGFTSETIREFHLGLTSEREQLYGMSGISNRISIPIMNEYGKGVKAISFRKIEDDELDSSPKYIHDRNDIIWNKGTSLYGFGYAVDEMCKTKTVVIVEGYFDLMSLYQIGIKNVVSIMGSTMTEEQIGMLKGRANKILYLKDNDEAGHKGFMSTLPKLLSEGFVVDVVKDLGYKCKDANDLCCHLKWDKDKIKKYIKDKTIDGILYYMGDFIQSYEDIVLRAKKEVLLVSNELLLNVKDNNLKEIYKDFIKEKMK